MAIHYTCRCGANIRLPSNVVGRKARCNSCGFIFVVPSPELNPLDAGPHTQKDPVARDGANQETKKAPPKPPPEDDGEWYPSSGTRPKTIDFDDASYEATWRSESTHTTDEDETPPEKESSARQEATDEDGEWYPSSGTRPELMDFADAAPEEPALTASVYSREAAAGAANFELPGGRDEDRSGIIEVQRPYWADLAGSFFFFLDAGSFVTFVMIVLINIVVIPLLSFAGPWGLIGIVAVWGYMCTFYMSVILETASGEDELPAVWETSLVELAVTGLRFVGTFAWAMLPATMFLFAEWVHTGLPVGGRGFFWALLTGIWPPEHMGVFMILAALGVAAWPVVALGVAIGNGFYGLWPITIIRTMLAAPVAYAAMYGVLLIAAALSALPYWSVYQGAIAYVAGKLGPGFLWATWLFNSGLGVYAMIVAMRAIGLYYRHYKRKFPWVAE